MLDTGNSYCKINLACLNISLFKWHYFHHNSSGKVVSGVNRTVKAPSAQRRQIQWVMSIPLLFCAKHTRRELLGKLSSSSTGSTSSQEKLDRLHYSPNTAVQVPLTPRLAPHCRWCQKCLLLKPNASKLLFFGDFFLILGDSWVSHLFLLTGLRMYSNYSRLKSSKERLSNLSAMSYIFAFIN